MRLRLIPVTITVAVLFLGVKVVDVLQGTQALSNRLLISEVGAQSEESKPAEEPKKEEKKTDEKVPEKLSERFSDKAAETAEKKPDEKAEEKPAEGEEKKAEKVKETAEELKARQEEDKKNLTKKKGGVVEDPGETVDRRFTTVEVELLENLSRRREELDHWAENIQIKEAALDATEKRINEKIEQIDAMKKEVGELLAQYNEKEDAKIRSLVKIYESMKPGDAARIFDEVEMPILLLVIDKMSEKKAAPILASMDPKKAKQITVQLAEQRRVSSARLHNVGGPVPLTTAPVQQ